MMGRAGVSPLPGPPPLEEGATVRHSADASLGIKKEVNNSSPWRGEVGKGARMEEVATDNPEKKLFIPRPVPAPLLEAARDLRKCMTDAEQLLWFCLRRKQMGGFRFRRQHPFERFIIDFYCCETKLAVELDGGHHNEDHAHERDNERTKILESYGIKVIRFWNSEVFRNTEGALQVIYDKLLERAAVSPLPGPPPLGEGKR